MQQPNISLNTPTLPISGNYESQNKGIPGAQHGGKILKFKASSQI